MRSFIVVFFFNIQVINKHLFKPTSECWGREVFGFCLFEFLNAFWNQRLNEILQEKQKNVKKIAPKAFLCGQHDSAQTEKFDRKAQTLAV